MDRPYNTCNGVYILDISQDFSSANRDALQRGGQSYVRHQLSRGRADGIRGNNGACGGQGCGRERMISETDNDQSSSGHRGSDHIGCGAYNFICFGVRAY